jgi:hypothetical protein
VSDNSGNADAPAKRRGGRPFQKGQSGNPGGRPKTAWLREWLAEATDKNPNNPRRLVIAQALYLTAIDRRHRDHVRAAELILAYELGKPVESVELSGPDGGPIESVDAFDGMTSERELARIQELLTEAKDAASQAAGGEADDAPGPGEPPEV